MDTAIHALLQLSARDFVSSDPDAPSSVRLSDSRPHARPLPEATAALEQRDQPSSGTAPAERTATHEVVGSTVTEASVRAEPIRTTPVVQAWTVTTEAFSALPRTVQDTLDELRLPPVRQTLSMMLTSLQEAKAEALTARRTTAEPWGIAQKIGKLGTGFFALEVGSTEENKLVGPPATPLPSLPGKVKPVGIGDLLLVRDHLLRYEGGEVAHVENVLRTERVSRDTRRLERTEQTFTIDTETTKEEQRDTQTTERFSLKRETSDTIKQDTEFKAGVQVTARYGPFIEVKANAEFSTKSVSEAATKLATEFSKDVVARSVSKIVEKVHERRTTTNVLEFEEK